MEQADAEAYHGVMKAGELQRGLRMILGLAANVSYSDIAPASSSAVRAFWMT
jgi:hypothetical protein